MRARKKKLGSTTGRVPCTVVGPRHVILEFDTLFQVVLSAQSRQLFGKHRLVCHNYHVYAQAFGYLRSLMHLYRFMANTVETLSHKKPIPIKLLNYSLESP